IRGKHGHAQGKIIHLTGQVLNQNGEPVRGAKIEIWQANTHGRYAHPSDTNSAPLDANFQGYSVQTTDAEGHYRFKTIKPGAYRVDANSMRTPHIHFDVMGKKDRLVTQMYFPGEPLNEKDAILWGWARIKMQRLARSCHLPRILNRTHSSWFGTSSLIKA